MGKCLDVEDLGQAAVLAELERDRSQTTVFHGVLYS